MKDQIKESELKNYIDTELEGMWKDERVVLLGLGKEHPYNDYKSANTILNIAPKKYDIRKIVGRTESYISISQFKPIVHKLSSLTLPIKHNGEKFVPVEYLEEHSPIGYDPIKELVEPLYETENWISHIEFYIIQYLIDWHFWIFDQSYFEKRLLIDKTKMI